MPTSKIRMSPSSSGKTSYVDSGRPMGATPFAFAYRMEAIIPTKIGMPTAKIAMQYQRDNNDELIKQLDWVDEMQGDTAIQMASYHQRAMA
ncbi:hypothetical protein AAG906_038943 [Vitis piasezkii]